MSRTLDQLDALSLVLFGVSAAFDFGDRPPPKPFVYLGPLLDHPVWVETGAGADLLSDDRPNVLVSFSTTFQNRRHLMARCFRALDGLNIRVVVTTGLAVRPDQLPSAANARVVKPAPHDDLVPRCALGLSHGGHGTVMRPLMRGVPTLTFPMGRDHPENASRLEALGAGLSPLRHAGRLEIRSTVKCMLADRTFSEAARQAAEAIQAEGDERDRAIQAFETLTLAKGVDEVHL